MTEIDAGRLRGELTDAYAEIDVVPSTGSTNADLVAAAADGAPDRVVLIAEEQTAGVGRRARSWVSPKGSGIYLSVLLRPREVAPGDIGSLPIVAGLAAIDVTSRLGVDATLKWPNDVLAGPGRGKCAGILAEAVAGDEIAVVLGIGLNVRPLGQDVPAGPGGLRPTSLAEHGASTTDRTEIALRLLGAFADRERRWRGAHGNLAKAGLLDDYRAHCETLGRQVRVVLPGDASLVGTAAEVDSAGRLIVVSEDGVRHTVFAGDVVHLRAVP
ncbi:MAG TPA: biotin--[acetyl-CoA-carboxylase] ligase [Amycolatopsis sp.]|nr:biotin--[acetyl-CoA-carboxylase] ligase [Amycolatopsis sp.]